MRLAGACGSLRDPNLTEGFPRVELSSVPSRGVFTGVSSLEISENPSQCVPLGVGWTTPDDGRCDFQ